MAYGFVGQHTCAIGFLINWLGSVVFVFVLFCFCQTLEFLMCLMWSFRLYFETWEEIWLCIVLCDLFDSTLKHGEKFECVLFYVMLSIVLWNMGILLNVYCFMLLVIVIRVVSRLLSLFLEVYTCHCHRCSIKTILSFFWSLHLSFV